MYNKTQAQMISDIPYKLLCRLRKMVVMLKLYRLFFFLSPDVIWIGHSMVRSADRDISESAKGNMQGFFYCHKLYS